MRVIQVNKANDNELYSKTGLEKELDLSVRTIERYIIDDDIENNAILVGKRKIYRGKDINKKIEYLVKNGDKFVIAE